MDIFSVTQVVALQVRQSNEQSACIDAHVPGMEVGQDSPTVVVTMLQFNDRRTGVPFQARARDASLQQPDEVKGPKQLSIQWVPHLSWV
jgi:hypothetical protein